ncbi:MAG: TIGR02281 family clan AA aspartic protease [Granulosicoccaceae bacterium]|jgi:aspartyl protease family protein
MRIYAPVLALCVLATPVADATDIVVNGLFSNKAVVTINGKQRILKPGKATREGVKLISADSKSALIEIDGQQKRFTLGGYIGTSYTRDEQPEVTIYRNQHNMFTAVGSINNFPVTFLLDTGASQVAMSTKDARRFGVNYQLKGQRTWVNTAAGIKSAWSVKLNKVKVGEIELRNVDGMVVDGAGPGGVLLGMSFLGRLEMNNDGQAMILKKKF